MLFLFEISVVGGVLLVSMLVVCLSFFLLWIDMFECLYMFG